MVRLAAVILILSALGASAAQPSAPACDLQAKSANKAGKGCGRAWLDANLRLNEIQLIGTAES